MSTPYRIRPYDETEISRASPADHPHMKASNQHLSSMWIMVEHAFEWLEGWFSALKELGMHCNLNDVYKMIKALVVIHNMGVD
ncbi:hypothetical protein WOLCODRAFT_80517 [Wolfiporia cocos MD-104 SS10]|uniref:DDE Tnp4 domain-containing protein n=1 Tax=Wolfiporia cocos (strain MD-104) TaxID=742152 RepID=A0A2H3J0K7_WOLCO|nr:hypothetical protein WOLCODRAFT_80517 [Wolfiporia cocos MD-104 SS10]